LHLQQPAAQSQPDKQNGEQADLLKEQEAESQQHQGGFAEGDSHDAEEAAPRSFAMADGATRAAAAAAINTDGPWREAVRHDRSAQLLCEA